MAFLITCIVGLFVGITLGLIGLGGTVIGIPSLVYGLELSLDDAVGVTLSGVLVTSILSMSTGVYRKTIHFKPGLTMAGISLITAPLGATACQHISRTTGIILFACLMFFTARIMWIRSQGRAPNLDSLKEAWAHSALLSKFLKGSRPLIFFGAIGGFLTGLLGVGGGLVVVPSLLTFTKTTFRQATATSMVAIAGFAFSGLMGHLFQGNGVPAAYAFPFISLCAIGLFIGRGLDHLIPEKWRTRLFTVMSVAVSISILVKELL